MMTNFSWNNGLTERFSWIRLIASAINCDTSHYDLIADFFSRDIDRISNNQFFDYGVVDAVHGWTWQYSMCAASIDIQRACILQCLGCQCDCTRYRSCRQSGYIFCLRHYRWYSWLQQRSLSAFSCRWWRSELWWIQPVCGLWSRHHDQAKQRLHHHAKLHGPRSSLPIAELPTNDRQEYRRNLGFEEHAYLGSTISRGIGDHVRH